MKSGLEGRSNVDLPVVLSDGLSELKSDSDPMNLVIDTVDGHVRCQVSEFRITDVRDMGLETRRDLQRDLFLGNGSTTREEKEE